MDTLTLEIVDHIALVGLNRPDKYNGLNMTMINELCQTAETINENPEVRAVILFGHGKGFCAGLDFKEVMMDPQNIPKLLAPIDGKPTNLAQEVAHIWKRLPIPVIAAMHGPVFGGGLQIAMGADIRIAHEQAELSIMEIKWGLIPDMSITTTLPQHVAMDKIKEMTFTGRKVSAKEALEIGLVTEVSESSAYDKAMALAQQIAQKSPDAIVAAKVLFNECLDLKESEKLAKEAELQKGIIGQKNQMAAMQANMSKTEPKFSPRKIVKF